MKTGRLLSTILVLTATLLFAVSCGGSGSTTSTDSTCVEQVECPEANTDCCEGTGDCAGDSTCCGGDPANCPSAQAENPDAAEPVEGEVEETPAQ